MPNDYTLTLPDGSTAVVSQDAPPTEQDYNNFLRSVGLPNALSPTQAAQVAPNLPVGTQVKVQDGQNLYTTIAAKGGRLQSFTPFDQRPELASLLTQPDLNNDQRKQIFKAHVDEYYTKLGEDSGFGRSFAEHAYNSWVNANPIATTQEAIAAHPTIDTSRQKNYDATKALADAQGRYDALSDELKRRGEGGVQQTPQGFLGTLGAMSKGDYPSYARTLTQEQLWNELDQATQQITQAKSAIAEKRVPALINEARDSADYYATEAQGLPQKVGAALGDITTGALANPIMLTAPEAKGITGLVKLGGYGAAQSELLNQPAAVQRGIQQQVSPTQAVEEGGMWATQALGAKVLFKLLAPAAKAISAQLGLKTPIPEGATPQEVKDIIDQYEVKNDLTPEQQQVADAVINEVKQVQPREIGLDELPPSPNFAPEAIPAPKSKFIPQKGPDRPGDVMDFIRQIRQIPATDLTPDERSGLIDAAKEDLGDAKQQFLKIMKVKANEPPPTSDETAQAQASAAPTVVPKATISDILGAQTSPEVIEAAKQATGGGKQAQASQTDIPAQPALPMPEKIRVMQRATLMAKQAMQPEIPAEALPTVHPQAPAVFLGNQEGLGPLYNLTEDIPGHPKNSTVTGPTLEKLGYHLPEQPTTTEGGESNATQTRNIHANVQIQPEGAAPGPAIPADEGGARGGGGEQAGAGGGVQAEGEKALGTPLDRTLAQVGFAKDAKEIIEQHELSIQKLLEQTEKSISMERDASDPENEHWTVTAGKKTATINHNTKGGFVVFADGSEIPDAYEDTLSNAIAEAKRLSINQHLEIERAAPNSQTLGKLMDAFEKQVKGIGNIENFDIRPTKNGSIYIQGEIVNARDADGEASDTTPFKLSIRNHDVSPFREREFGSVDKYWMAKDPTEPTQVYEPMQKALKWIQKESGDDSTPENTLAEKISKSGATYGHPGFIDLGPLQEKVEQVLEFGKSILGKVKDFGEWGAQMVGKFGEKIRGYLDALWNHITGGEPKETAGNGKIAAISKANDLTPIRATPGNPRPSALRIPASDKSELGFNTTLRESPHTSPLIRDSLANEASTITNKATLELANGFIQQHGMDRAADLVRSDQKPNAVTFATAMRLADEYTRDAERLDTEGKTAQRDEALVKSAEMVDYVSRSARTQGQTVQALSMWNRITPQGMRLYMAKLARQAGTTLSEGYTPEQIAEMNRLEKLADATDDPLQKMALHSRRYTLAHSILPASVGLKARGILNMAMILHPKLAMRILSGQSSLFIADRLGDMVALPMDFALAKGRSFLGLSNGIRTVDFPQIAALARGFSQPWLDFKSGWKMGEAQTMDVVGKFKEGVRTMLDMANLTSSGIYKLGDINRSYNTLFSGKVMNGLQDAITALHNISARAFHEAAFQNSITTQLKLANQAGAGLLGPTPAMTEIALMDANRAIFRDPNWLAQTASQGRQLINQGSTLGLSKNIGLGQAIIPMTQVPASMVLRSAEFSPLGFLKMAYEGMGPLLTGKAFDQRAFSKAFGRSLVGTGAAALGYWLYQQGILTGAPYKNLDMEAARKAMGVGQYSVNVSALKRKLLAMNFTDPSLGKMEDGDLITSYGEWALPASFPVGMGANMAQAQQQHGADWLRGARGTPLATFLGAAENSGLMIGDMPLLRGVKDFVDNLSNYGAVEGLARSYASLPGQIVPTSVREIEQLRNNTIPEMRQGGGAEPNERMKAIGATELRRAESGVPGLGEALGFPAKYDFYGNPEERYQAGTNNMINVLFNPAMITHIKNDPNLSELFRLYNTTGQTSQFPRAIVPANLPINGKSTGLNPQQLSDFEKVNGLLTKTLFDNLMSSPSYLKLSDIERVHKVSDMLSGIEGAVKVLLLGNRPSAYSKPEIAAMKYIVENRPDLLAIARQQPFNQLSPDDLGAQYRELLRTKSQAQTKTWLDAQREVASLLRAVQNPMPATVPSQ